MGGIAATLLTEYVLPQRPFCSAAFHAFGLIVRNAIRLLVVNGVAAFLIFITKLFIVCSSAVVGVIFLTQIDGALTSADAIASNWAFPLV